MIRRSIRDLRADLATAVRAAGAGQRIVVTVGGRPVAQLGPVGERVDGLTIDDLVARGAVTPPRRVGTFAPPDAVALGRAVRLDRALAEVRG
jgi:prevent-host-death family protein